MAQPQTSSPASNPGYSHSATGAAAAAAIIAEFGPIQACPSRKARTKTERMQWRRKEVQQAPTLRRAPDLSTGGIEGGSVLINSALHIFASEALHPEQIPGSFGTKAGFIARKIEITWLGCPRTK